MYTEQLFHELQTMPQLRKADATNRECTNNDDSARTPKVSLPYSGHGVDRACPKSVTKLSNYNMDLDHYQLGSIRRQSRHFDPNPRPTTSRGDEDFQWYDLDAIRRNSENHSNCADHNSSAGLVFTTQRQLLKQKAEDNHFVDPSFATSKSDHGPIFELDSLVFWIQKIGFSDQSSDTSNSQHTHSSQESPGDREIWERIKSLEREGYSNNCTATTTSGNFRGGRGDASAGDEDSTSISSSFSSL